MFVINNIFNIQGQSKMQDSHCVNFMYAAAPMRSHIEKLNCIAAHNITCVIGSRSADSYDRVWLTLRRILTATKGKSSA